VGPGGQAQTLTIPKTSAEVRELLLQRRELSEQLNSVASRRQSLSVQIRIAPDGASRTGLEDRLRLLDQRILRLESDIDGIGRQLASAPAELVAGTEIRPPQGGGDDWEEGLAFGALFAFLGVARFIKKKRLRRGRHPAPAAAAQLPAESAQRLERLEHGVEAIAIEVERISEGQRFVTRLLSEAQAPVGASHRIPQAAAERQHVDADSVESSRQ